MSKRNLYVTFSLEKEDGGSGDGATNVTAAAPLTSHARVKAMADEIKKATEKAHGIKIKVLHITSWREYDKAHWLDHSGKFALFVFAICMAFNFVFLWLLKNGGVI